MSFKLMAKAMDIKTGSSTSKLILLKLCDNANDNGECWPSQELISEQCELSKRSVIENIKKLEKQGLVTKQKIGKNKNKYQINLSGADIAVVNEVHHNSERGALYSSERGALAIEPINNKPTIESITKARESFEKFRKIYPGSKRGLDVEFTEFQKKHPDWIDIVPLLYPAIVRQEQERLNLSKRNQFVPSWKNLKTYLNQSCWQEEYAKPPAEIPF
jgi:DNA-binding Lrp family transcriptional regulator